MNYECPKCHGVGTEAEFFRCEDGVLICAPCEEPVEQQEPFPLKYQEAEG